MSPSVLGGRGDDGELTGRWQVWEIGVLKRNGGWSSGGGASVIDSFDLLFAVTQTGQRRGPTRGESMVSGT